MKHFILLVTLIGVSFWSFAQDNCANGITIETLETDIIPNPSFEEYRWLPTHLSQMKGCKSWSTSPSGADYIHKNGYYPNNVPTTLPDGNGIAGGFAMWRNEVSTSPPKVLTELLKTIVNKPLLGNRKYELSIDIAGSFFKLQNCGVNELVGLPNVDIEVFGYAGTDSASFFTAPRCPKENNVWKKLGATSYNPSSGWQTVKIDLSLPHLINQLIIGPSCEGLPQAYHENCSPYFLYDNLRLKSILDTSVVTIKSTGKLCTGDIELTAKAGFNGSWQWSKNDVELPGETNGTLKVGEKNLGSGIYKVRFDYKGQCEVQEFHVNPAVKPNASFSGGEGCFGESSQFQNTSTTSNANINLIYWDFNADGVIDAQGPFASYKFSTEGQHKVVLAVTDNVGCPDTLIKFITIHPRPNVAFTARDTCLNEAIEFEAIASGVSGTLDYSWNLGDQNSSNAVKFKHTYATANTYAVKLEVTSAHGCKNSSQRTVEIFDLPLANFSLNNVNPGGCSGSEFRFVDNSDHPNSPSVKIKEWNWDFETTAGFEKTGKNNISWIYKTSGIHNPKLTVIDNNGCSHSYSKLVEVKANPAAKFDFTDTCQGEFVQFKNLSSVFGNANYKWTFENNDKEYTKDVKRAFGAAGKFPVELIVVSSEGCSDTIKETVIIYGKPVASIAGDFKYCSGDSLKVENKSSHKGFDNSDLLQKWNWKMGSQTSQLFTPNWVMGTGNQTVTLISESSYGCKDTAKITLNTHPNPVASFTTPSNGCQLGSVTIQNQSTGNIASTSWDLGDGSFTDQINPRHTYQTSGEKRIMLVVKSDKNCSDTLTKTFTIYGKPTAYFNTDPICTKDNFSLKNQTNVMVSNALGDSVTKWQWKVDGQTSNLKNPAFTGIDASATATLIAISKHGCSDTISKLIDISPLPKIVVGISGQDACEEACITITNNSSIASGSISSFDWDFGNGQSSSLEQPGRHCYSSTKLDSFSVRLTAVSDKGCEDKFLLQNVITVYPRPSANLNEVTNAPYCPGDSLELENVTVNVDSIVWSYVDSSAVLKGNLLKVGLIEGENLAKLVVRNSYSCFDTITYSLNVEYCYGPIEIPNVFTPNNDGSNDEFYISEIPPGDNKLRIYNRWGEVVFASSGERLSAWSGQSAGGKPVPEGVYYVLLNVDGEEYSGYCTLIR